MHNKTYIAVMGIVVAGIISSVIGVMLHSNGRPIKGVNKYENSTTTTTTIENESEKQTDITTTTKKVPIENKSDSTEEKQKTTTKSSAATTKETQTEIAETTTITTTTTTIQEVATIETTIPITTTYEDNTYVETESDWSSSNEYNTEEYYGEYSPYDLQTMGVISWGGYRYTYYSENVLPGYGLQIEGRHTDEYGFVCDGEGYICVASSSLPWGTIVDTPFGRAGKVYDSCGAWDVIDVYVSW